MSFFHGFWDLLTDSTFWEFCGEFAAISVVVVGVLAVLAVIVLLLYAL